MPLDRRSCLKTRGSMTSSSVGKSSFPFPPHGADYRGRGRGLHHDSASLGEALLGQKRARLAPPVHHLGREAGRARVVPVSEASQASEGNTATESTADRAVSPTSGSGDSRPPRPHTKRPSSKGPIYGLLGNRPAAQRRAASDLPRNYKRGAAVLWITDDVDKNGTIGTFHSRRARVRRSTLW